MKDRKLLFTLLITGLLGALIGCSADTYHEAETTPAPVTSPQNPSEPATTAGKQATTGFVPGTTAGASGTGLTGGAG